MSVSGIQGLPLEVTVVGCVNLKDTEWISKQDPYVSVEYGSARQRTRTCTDGGKNPSFQEKFVVTLIEGLREVQVSVWNSNTLSTDDFIGNGRVQLQKVLSQGFDDSSWTIQDKCGRYSGEVRLILHYTYANANHSAGGKTKIHGSVPGYAPPTAPPYSAYPTAHAAYPATHAAYPAAHAAYPAAHAAYPAAHAYGPRKSVNSAYPPPGPAYPPSAYPTYPQGVPAYLPPPATAVYPPPPAGYPACPPPAYPPQYPPAPHTSVYPPGPPAGVYPPPPFY